MREARTKLVRGLVSWVVSQASIASFSYDIPSGKHTVRALVDDHNGEKYYRVQHADHALFPV